MAQPRRATLIGAAGGGRAATDSGWRRDEWEPTPKRGLRSIQFKISVNKPNGRHIDEAYDEAVEAWRDPVGRELMESLLKVI